MLTPGKIREVERVENDFQARIKSAVANRHLSKEAYGLWVEVTTAWHNHVRSTDLLWSDDFRIRLRGSEREAIEDAILYLEVDPWYFRSGYLKARLIRGLKAAKLTDRDRSRLRNVIWNIAAGKNRREFRDFCSLARLVASDEFRSHLDQVSTERDLAAKGKFSFLLSYLDRHWRSPGI